MSTPTIPALPVGAADLLAQQVSGPIATVAAIVVGGLLILILVVWLAKKVLHKIIGVGISVAAAAATHEGTHAWITHLTTTGTHT